jgi:hypothetical protein
MGILSEVLDKTAMWFVQEAFYSIIAPESVMLPEIDRQLEHDIGMDSSCILFTLRTLKNALLKRGLLIYFISLNSCILNFYVWNRLIP